MSDIIIILSVLIPLIVLALIGLKFYDESKVKLSKGFYYFLPITDDETFQNLEYIGSQKDYCTFRHLRGYEVRLEHKYVKLMKLH